MAVGRMLLPSHAVEGGKKGKAVTLLHAWKDQLWVMGGEGRPPRPRLLIAGPDEEEDVDEVWESEEIEADAESQPESSSDRDTPKELSPEGAYLEACSSERPLRYCRGIPRPKVCPSQINFRCTVETATRVLPNHCVRSIRDVYLAVSFFPTHQNYENPSGY